MNYNLLSSLTDLENKRVLVRFDFNVPVQDGKIVEDYRIKQSLPTLQYLRDHKAKIIIISHIEGGSDTLRPIYEYLKNLGLPITFCEDCIEKGAEHCGAMQPGDVVLCENVRLYDGEKKNDPEFAKKLAALGDIYVNDAFSVSHRKHASVVGVPKIIPGYLGFQFEQEITNLSSCFKPDHPFLFILGGAKFDTKLPLIEKFSQLADDVFIGGALANDIFKTKGLNVGKSLVAQTAIDLSAIAANSKVMVPIDVVVNSEAGDRTVAAEAVTDADYIADAGSETLAMLKQKIMKAKHILWNGPLGNYEKGYTKPTLELATMIAEATKQGTKTILGGGDTLAAIVTLGLDNSAFTFVSTGGGAMLDYLANETLPGLEMLKK